MNKIVIIFGLLFCGLNVTAQDDNIADIRKDFITKELQLTPSEAEAFFPVYNEYIQKKKERRKSLRSELRGSEKSVDKIIDIEQDLIDLQREYLEKFRKILPEKKVVQLLEAEKKFKTMMVQRLRD
ncbi:MAG: hypothetical protein ACK5UE_07980 [Chitinophagales bacterium]|jgi:hypothetical protein|nr:hypothetical protein [Sphingobacteriales bacterium]